MQIEAYVYAVFLFAASIPLFFGVLMLVYWRTQRTFRGFGFWVLAHFCIGLGYFLLMLRGRAPDFLPLILGNLLVIGGFLLVMDGIDLFFNRGPHRARNYLILGIYAILQVYFIYNEPNPNARWMLFSSLLVLLQTWAGFNLLRWAPPKLRRASQTTAFVFFTLALISLTRVVYVLSQNQTLELLADWPLTLLSFALICSVTIMTFSLFFLISARLESDLLESQRDLVRALETNQRRVVQLGLLDETSASLAESMEETEILQRMVKAIVNRFGYAEAAISLLVDQDQLEVVAIDGAEDIGYRQGFRQKIGEGIIGRTAQERRVYLSGDIEHDPYYFTIGKRSGSAICVPMEAEGHLLGVLYVESVKLDAFGAEDIQTLEPLAKHAVTAIQKARLFANAQASLRAISTLQSVSQTILSSLDLKQIFQSVVQLLKDTFQYTHVSIYILRDQVLHLEAQAGYPEELVIREIPAAEGISGRTVQSKQTQFVRDVTGDPAFLRADHDIESEICVPLLKDDMVLGVLNVEGEPGHPLSDDDVRVLNALVGPVVIAIENASLHNEVVEMALTDGLTGVYNRRAFDQMLAGELNRARRYVYPLSLVIIDMDNFKEFNDRHGHLAGDDRLREVARLLRGDLRGPDILARYGGEEFALILPCTGKEKALVLAERLRAAAEQCVPLKTDGNGPIAGYTISIGVASFPENGQTAEALLYAADQAEMRAKKLGKNCAVAAGDDVPVAQG